MKVISNRDSLYQELKILRKKTIDIGFVPTMGAIHEGHISLIQNSVKENKITVCSIYVNPKQFNDKKDLINYPRDLLGDMKKLEEANCDILFFPSDNEIYPNNFQDRDYKFTSVLNILEGERRPGHFQGVLNVVQILFELIQPTRAYFGEKDYQQLWIIKFFTLTYRLPIIICPIQTIRDSDGLALSSRNKRLSVAQKKTAINLIIAIRALKEKIEKHFKESPSLLIEKNQLQKLRLQVLNSVLSNSSIKLDYFEIIEVENFSFVTNLYRNQHYRVLIAAYIGEVRLIDNTAINEIC